MSASHKSAIKPRNGNGSDRIEHLEHLLNAQDFDSARELMGQYNDEDDVFLSMLRIYSEAICKGTVDNGCFLFFLPYRERILNDMDTNTIKNIAMAIKKSEGKQTAIQFFIQLRNRSDIEEYISEPQDMGKSDELLKQKPQEDQTLMRKRVSGRGRRSRNRKSLRKTRPRTPPRVTIPSEPLTATPRPKRMPIRTTPSPEMSRSSKSPVPLQIEPAPVKKKIPHEEKPVLVDEVEEKVEIAVEEEEEEEEFVFVGGNKYIMKELIGRGGSCQVFRVRDAVSDQNYALKVTKYGSKNERFYELLINEANLLAKLTEANAEGIIRLHAFEEHDDEIHFVLELGGEDLHQLLRRTRENSDICLPWISKTFTQMCKCVGVIHKEGIIHRDLKPQNFLFVNEELKLIDFGIAKQFEHEGTVHVHQKDLVGTLNYICPESLQKWQKNNDFASGFEADVWSLGCILYEMVIYWKGRLFVIPGNASRSKNVCNTLLLQNKIELNVLLL
ncbi:hypothetical protein PCE1_003085 [Barthelona sp. PCE]